MEETGISIVSHGHAALVHDLLRDLDQHCASAIRVILTLNIEETLPFEPAGFRFPVLVVRNKNAQGFGANHNAAFRRVQTTYFCPVNPDIRLGEDPFPALLAHARKPETGAVAPAVSSPSGTIENNARRFPTPFRILKKALGGGDADYRIGETALLPDWVGGMFMLFRRETFERVGGFDERYFMYYEDVDICWRLRSAGLEIVMEPRVRVVHDARRDSHRKFRYLIWHVRSMLRFFTKRAIRGGLAIGVRR